MSSSILLFDEAGSRTVEPAEALASLTAGRGLLWVDVSGPEAADVELMAQGFGFHPLAIEDTRNQRQRPKIEEYDDHLFIILNPVSRDGDDIMFRELDLFLGDRYVVTVHQDGEPVVAEVQARLRRQNHGAPTAGFLAYLLMDTTVDGYFPVLDDAIEAIDAMEDSLVTGPVRLQLEDVFRTKRSLLDMQRVVASQRDMFTLITRHEMRYLPGEQMDYYLRDVLDHVLRINDQVGMAREMVASVIELYLTATSNQLNRVVNRLTVFTVIIGVMAVVTGFYGMNFEQTWPPHDAEWGIPASIAIMGLAAAALLWLMRRMRWW